MVWLDRFTYRIMASPILWGGVAATAFHFLVRKSGEAIPPALLRCLTGSWDAYLSTTMFCMALAFIVVRAVEMVSDYLAIRQSVPASDDARTPSVSPAEILENLDKNTFLRRSGWYQRLQEAHQLAKRSTASSDISSQLQVLSDSQFEQLRQRYSLARLLTWAIPSVGSVATVLAIAKAVELLSPGPSDAIFAAVASGLSAAFQTFAFTIGLSVALVVMRHLLEQIDHRIFSESDRQLERLFASTKDTKAAPADSMQDQLRQLADGLRSISTTLAQQVNVARINPGVPNVSVAAPSSGMDPKEVELLVQRAVAAVAQRMPTTNVSNDGGSIDAAGWKSLQQVLQKLAHVLELQNQKLESEGRVSKHLSAIIDEGLSETRPALKVRNSA